MVGFLTLSSEETEIVLGGRIEDPRYRPFPGSRKDRDEDNYYDDEDEDEVQPDQIIDTTQARLERLVAAKHWQRSSSGLLLMVARDLPISGQASKTASETLTVVAVSYVCCGPRTSTPGTRRMFVGPWKTVTPSSVLELLNSMRGAQHCNTLKMVTGPIRELSQAASEKVAERLKEILPDYPLIRAELTEGIDTRRSRSKRELQRRDAVATALRIFRQKWRSVEPVPFPEPSTFAEEIDESVRGVENDFIEDDVAVFPGWERSAQNRRGWWEFRSGHRRLLIKNLNVSTAETRTGADLIYVRRAPDAVVLVQYKMLERLDKTGEFIYRPDKRLPAQVDRMLSCSSIENDGTVANPDHYRIGRGFTFVKFLIDEGKKGLADDEVTPGYYLAVSSGECISCFH